MLVCSCLYFPKSSPSRVSQCSQLSFTPPSLQDLSSFFHNRSDANITLWITSFCKGLDKFLFSVFLLYLLYTKYILYIAPLIYSTLLLPYFALCIISLFLYETHVWKKLQIRRIECKESWTLRGLIQILKFSFELHAMHVLFVRQSVIWISLPPIFLFWWIPMPLLLFPCLVTNWHYDVIMTCFCVAMCCTTLSFHPTLSKGPALF